VEDDEGDNLARIETSTCTRAKLALVYARTRIEIKSAVLRERAHALFSDRRLRACRDLGDRVSDIVTSMDIDNPLPTVESCLEALEIKDYVRLQSIRQDKQSSN